MFGFGGGALGAASDTTPSTNLGHRRRFVHANPIGVGEQTEQFDDAVDLQFFQYAGAVFGHGLLADAQLSGDLLSKIDRAGQSCDRFRSSRANPHHHGSRHGPGDADFAGQIIGTAVR